MYEERCYEFDFAEMGVVNLLASPIVGPSFLLSILVLLSGRRKLWICCQRLHLASRRQSEP
eukprot:2531516-Rhodomonas_salina.3